MSSDTVSEIDAILDHLRDRLIPSDLRTGEQYPDWYEEELSDRYADKMRQRARRLLQQVAPKKRTSILAFFENEEEVRDLLSGVQDQREALQDIGYDEESIRSVNQIHDMLRSVRKEVVGQSHAGFVEEHPPLGLFLGEGSEATF